MTFIMYDRLYVPLMNFLPLDGGGPGRGED